MHAQSSQSTKLRYNLDAMLRGLKEQYPEISGVASEKLTQGQISEVFARRKQRKRSS